MIHSQAGVGKSSIINRVFHIDGVEAAVGSHDQRDCLPLTWLLTKTVEDFDVGEAEIDEEFFSPDNPYFVSHDSRGFELGSTNTLNIVRNFILRRSNEGLPLKDRLHAVW
jgi:predicted GTPase